MANGTFKNIYFYCEEFDMNKRNLLTENKENCILLQEDRRCPHSTMDHSNHKELNIQIQFPQEIANIDNIINSIKNDLNTPKEHSPQSIPPEKWREVSIQALEKMALYLVQLTQMCLPHFQNTYPDAYQHLLSVSQDNRLKIVTLLDQFYNKSSTNSKVLQLRKEMEHMKIRFPKAPVSAYYLFYLYKHKDKSVSEKKDLSILWNSLSESQKEPYYLLAQDIRDEFDKRKKVETTDANFSKKKNLQLKQGENKIFDVKKMKEEWSSQQASQEDVLSNSQSGSEMGEGNQREYNDVNQEKGGENSVSASVQNKKNSPVLTTQKVSMAFN